MERSVKYFTGGLKPLSRRANLTLNSDIYLVCMKDPQLINASSPGTYKSIYNKEIKAKIRTQQKIKLNTGAKEIQQLGPGGPGKQPKHQAPTTSSTDKILGYDPVINFP